MAVNDLYNLVIYLSTPGAEAQISFGYKQTGGTNDKDTLQSAVDYYQANFLAALANCLSNEVFIDQLRMDQVSVGDELPGIVSQVGQVGARASESLPFGAAAIVQLITDAPNSKHNGRVYLPGIGEADQDEGVLNAAILALLVTWTGNIQATLPTSLPQTATFEANVISRVENGIPRVPPVGFNVETTVVRVNMYSQRRRITSRRGNS